VHRSALILRAVLGALIVVALVPVAALGIPRDAVIARGKVWVDKHTPYSQSRYAYENGSLIPPTSTPSPSKLGYRTDCSGFVSMCFDLTTTSKTPLSLTTRSLSPSVVATTTKSALLPGDILLKKGSHVVLFVEWVDSSQTELRAYEERGTKYGCVESVRDYAELYSWGYRAYRFRKIDDFYPDCQQAIYGPTRYETAVAASRVAFPATGTAAVKALVVSDGEAWTGNLGAAALAGASGGPLLLVTKSSLPATAQAAIKRLRPQTVYVVGGPSTITTAVTDKIAALGPSVVRVSGRDRFVTTAAAARKAVALGRASGRTIDAAYLVESGAFADGLAASSVAARTGSPILLTNHASVPAATLDAIKKLGIRHVYIVGGTSSVKAAVVSVLKRRGITVTRLGGANYSETALLVAHHGIARKGAGMSWSGAGVVSATKPSGELACAVAQGEVGSVLLFTPGDKLDATVAAELTQQRAAIGRVRVFGGYDTIGLAVRTAIARIMRAK